MHLPKSNVIPSFILTINVNTYNEREVFSDDYDETYETSKLYRTMRT